MLQRMTATMEPPRHYEAAIRAMSEAAATAEATHAPIRLAYWRMAALDTLLARLEELRLAGERELPDDTLELVMTFAQRHNPELCERMAAIDAGDVNAVHDAVFEAQGRVMLELAELRRVPNWQDLDLVLEPGGEEAA
ncbi:MAG: hypothetical protein M3077_01365 [Candidatus Dormibacteraeota bacterium]|nr:hypothetical protein [Candidatus Dormibacteraeota bacterium]